MRPAACVLRAGAQAHLVAHPIAHLLGNELARPLDLGELQAGGLEDATADATVVEWAI